MPKKIRVSCDHCGEDISSTGSMPTFRLRLIAEALPHLARSIKAVLVRPPIKEELVTFCHRLSLQLEVANCDLKIFDKIKNSPR